MSAENKERLCGDNINDRSVCGQTRLSLQQIHLQNKCINVLILRPESAWRGVAIMAHNGVECFMKSHFYFFNILVMARSIFLENQYRQRIQVFKCYSINFMTPMCLPYYQTFQTFHHRSWCCVNADPSTNQLLLQTFSKGCCNLSSFFLSFLNCTVQCSGFHQNVCMHV